MRENTLYLSSSAITLPPLNLSPHIQRLCLLSLLMFLFVFNLDSGASEVAQQAKAHASEADDLKSISRSHKMEGESRPPQDVL